MRPRHGRRAQFGLALLLTLIATAAWVSPAAATSCGDLQGALDASSAGDTITLDPGSACDSLNSVLPFTLPAHAITLDGNAATIDGEATTQSMTGVDIGATTIKNFTFVNGVSPLGGGAVGLGGTSSPTLSNLSFYGNVAASNDSGGGLFVGVSGDVTLENSRFGDGTPAHANSAGSAGGARIGGANVTIKGSTFDGNRAVNNGSGGGLVASGNSSLTVTGSTFAHNVINASFGSGGGASLNSQGDVLMTGNHFTANHITPLAGGNYAEGAGLLLFGSTSKQLTSTGNTFDGNVVDATGSATNFSSYGAGAAYEGINLVSRGDRFVDNSLPAHGSTSGVTWGAGVSIGDCGGGTTNTMTNAIIAGNTAAGAVAGGAIYAGCGGGPVALTLINSTVTDNTVGTGTAGIYGGAGDSLTLRNTIVYGDSGGDELHGFAQVPSVDYSDVCSPANPSDPWPAGTGNICAAPQFGNAAGRDYRQLLASPTVDAGSNDLVPAGVTTDYEGDPRIGATTSGPATVDIGADERGPIPCSFLTADLAAATAGTVITLKQGVVCTGNYTLPSAPITLQAAGSGATFNPGGSGRALTGTNVGQTTISNLTFRNGSAPSGGAILLSGASAPAFSHDRFFGNHATAALGGAVVVLSSGSAGTVSFTNSTFGNMAVGGAANSAAQTGGALFVSSNVDVAIQNSTFSGNVATNDSGAARVVLVGDADVTVSGSTFTSNSVSSAGSADGGGALSLIPDTGSAVTVSDSTFHSNQVAGNATATKAVGGALVIRTDLSPAPTAHLSGNTFTGNDIFAGSPTQFAPSGSALFAFGVDLSSRGDRFTNNFISPEGSGEAWGTIGLIGCSNSGTGMFTFDNAVVAGNTAFAGGASAGVGIYVGCADGPASLTLRNSTVAGNQGFGGTAGVWGGADDTLTVVNSIIADNTFGADLTGFNTRTVTNSDVCFAGAAHPGAGNLCVSPALVDPAHGDVHETTSSPTIDTGSNADVPGGTTTDYEGDPRTRDGNGDGTATVDMGADESPTVNPPPSGDGGGGGDNPGGGETPPPGGETTTTPPPGVGTTPIPPRLAFGKTAQSADGTLTLTLTIPGDGALELLASYAKSGKAANAAALKLAKNRLLFARVKKSVKAGTLTIKLRPSKAAKRLLAKRKKLVVKIVMAFTPKAGKPTTLTKTVTIRLKR